MIKRNCDKVPAILKKQIAQEVANGLSLTDISKQYGVTRQTISHWKNNDERFIREVERCENGIIQDRINAANMLLSSTLNKQILDLQRMADDPDVPLKERIGIKKYLIDKQIENAKSTSIRNQDNLQINIDTNNNKNNIEDILNSFNTLIDNNTETDNTAETDNNIIDIDTNTDITDNN